MNFENIRAHTANLFIHNDDSSISLTRWCTLNKVLLNMYVIFELVICFLLYIIPEFIRSHNFSGFYFMDFFSMHFGTFWKFSNESWLTYSYQFLGRACLGRMWDNTNLITLVPVKYKLYIVMTAYYIFPFFVFSTQ